jgi:hypothetical protein
MKVYLAAPYATKELMQERAEELRHLGIEVTSSWIDEPHKPSTQMHELTHEEHQQYALRDVEDVIAADVLVFHVDPTGKIVRAGRHVEFGMAVLINQLIRGMPILVVGDAHENIFHHLPYVTHYATWEDLKSWLWVQTRDIHADFSSF